MATITDGVDRELEETGGRSPSPSLERELGTNKALKSALPKASPPANKSRRVVTGCQAGVEHLAGKGVSKESANELGLRVYGHLGWNLEVE